jgi:hypothetical protein
VLGATLVATPARAATLDSTASALSWGFKASWNNYIAAFGGTATATDGATANAGVITWPTTSSAFDPDTKAGNAVFGGTVRWQNPSHGIDITMTSPRVVLTADGTGELYYSTGAGEVLGATIGAVTVGAPTASGANSTVDVTGSSVTLTADGGSAFGGSYAAGTVVDDLSFALTYVTPSTALPTTVTLAPRTSTVVTGGNVELVARTTTGVAGSVEFFDGSTALATVAVASAAATYIATDVPSGARAYTAVFTPTVAADFSPSTSTVATVTASAKAGALSGNVSGATLEWGVSDYAQVGSAVPSVPAAAGTSGWKIATEGGPEAISPANGASLGFRLTGGTGSVNTTTGVGAISYPGSVTYSPYAAAAGSFTLSGFVLDLTSTTRGTLTAYISTKSTQVGTSVGATRVTLANFDVASLTSTAGAFTLTTAAPDFAGTVAAGTYSGAYTGAWPTGFISAMESTFRAFFYQSGTTQGNLNKPAKPITASFTATTPTTTALTVSSTSVVAGGAVLLAARVTTAVPGSVEFFDGDASLGTVAVASAAASLRVAGVSAGSHDYRGVFTPTSNAYGTSTGTVTVTTTTQASPLVGNVSGATLDWGVSDYAQVGSSVPSVPAVAGTSGWKISTEGGPEAISPANGASLGFRLTAGSGTADPATGVGAISYPGSVTYSPYGTVAGSFTLSGFVLTATSASEGKLTAYLSTKSSQTADAIGLSPVTLATFDIASLTGTSGSFVLTSATPDYEGTVAAGTYSGAYTSAWPTSFVNAMDASFRAFFYQSGTTQGNINKLPKPIAASYTAIAETDVTLSARSASVVTGGGAALTATVTSGVTGTVEFFEGETAVGSVAVTSGSGTYVVTGLTAGAHTYKAVFTPTNEAQYGISTSGTVTVNASAATAPLTGNVSGATLDWGFSDYAQVGASLPSVPAAAGTSGWKISTEGGPEAISPANGASLGFRLTGGTGSANPLTGVGAISYPGSVSYSPYSTMAGSFTLSHFTLETLSPTEGKLTAYFSSKSTPSASTAGATLVTLATFDISTLVGTSGSFALTSAAPDYAGTVAAGTYSGPYTAAWPASLVAAMEPSFRAFFYQSGTTQGNINKAPKVITAAYTATAAPTTTTLTASQTSGLQAGDTVRLTAKVPTAGAAGTISIALDGDVLGTGPAGTDLEVVTGKLAKGTHSAVATFTPTSTIAQSASSASVQLKVAAAGAIPAGSFSWGVYAPFNAYITGPIAHGSITTSNGASGQFTFQQASGGTYSDATERGTVKYRGAVRYYGHDGQLDQTLSNPVVRVDSATSGTLLITTGGNQVAFASLNLAGGTKSESSGAVRYAGVPTTLLSGGVAFFGGNYAVGTTLAPASFVIGSASSYTPAASTTSTSEDDEKWTAPATPPSTTGISTDDADSLVEGEEATFTAEGFEANEEGIRVVMYSTPTVLANDLKADANGSVSWTGRLPSGLTGEHTITFQGSVDRGLVVNIAPAVVETVGCPVSDATLTWGFKESFRSYISGSIANGEWTVSDGATYEVPNFGFASGTGGYDGETGEGLIGFTGSIEFTGHDGALDTTVANPQVRFIDADTAVILLDISGETQDGTATDQQAVEFVELDLSAAAVTNVDGAVTITDAPATLTSAGSAAFGTYETGEAFDAVTLAFTTPECAATPAVTEEPEEAPVAENEGGDLGWLVWVLAALLLVAIIVVVVLVVRRRK